MDNFISHYEISNFQKKNTEGKKTHPETLVVQTLFKNLHFPKKENICQRARITTLRLH